MLESDGDWQRLCSHRLAHQTEVLRSVVENLFLFDQPCDWEAALTPGRQNSRGHGHRKASLRFALWHSK